MPERLVHLPDHRNDWDSNDRADESSKERSCGYPYGHRDRVNRDLLAHDERLQDVSLKLANKRDTDAPVAAFQMPSAARATIVR